MAMVRERRAMLADVREPNAGVTSAEFDEQFEDREDLHVELIGGRVFYKMSQNLLHMQAVASVLQALFATDRKDLLVLTQGTIYFDEDRLEPDAMLVQTIGARGNRRLRKEEVLLAIEIAVSSLAYDRGEKLRAYARGGTPEFWIVNPIARQVEIYRDPAGEEYRDVSLLLPGEAVAPLALPSAQIKIDDLLPETTATE